MVKPQPSKLMTRVRFPLPAPSVREQTMVTNNETEKRQGTPPVASVSPRLFLLNANKKEGHPCAEVTGSKNNESIGFWR